MSIFTTAELQHFVNALPLLKEKGPGWAIKNADDFARWRAEVACLESKVKELHEKTVRFERADKIDMLGVYQIDNPAHPNHGEMVTIEHKLSDEKNTFFRVRTFSGIRVYNVRADELRG